jgi:hypothetical protein
MRRVEGVTVVKAVSTELLKRYALFFDRVHVSHELEFLSGSDFLSSRPYDLSYISDDDFEFIAKSGFLARSVSFFTSNGQGTIYNRERFIREMIVEAREESPDAEIVSIYDKPFVFWDDQEHDEKQRVIQVALEKFPPPDETCAWQDIMDFKAEMHDRQWHFRRFLDSLANKKQTEAEIRDDIEWTTNEYAKAMKIHNLKAGNSFAEVYIVPVCEILEDLAKINWSKIAKGALGVKKRNVELMEAELKAPGRECAYVFEAQKRFGHIG